jgi:hypothetical protein
MFAIRAFQIASFMNAHHCTLAQAKCYFYLRQEGFPRQYSLDRAFAL